MANERRPLPPAASGVRIDKGAVPEAGAEKAPETPETPGAASGTGQGANGQQGQAQGRTEGGSAEPPAEPPKQSRPVAARSNGRSNGRPAPAPAVPALDKATKSRYRWLLDATAGKLGAANRAQAEAEEAWDTLVAEARANGVPAVMILAAAARAEVDIPEEQ